MKYRRFGRMGWMVSEIGYGMWGMGNWTGSDDEESLCSLQRAVDLGCNFFDTAWVYGDGHSEMLLGKLLRSNPDKRLYTATKIPPKNGKWPANSAMPLDDTYPPDHIEAYLQKSLAAVPCDSFDLVQFHTWDDSWMDDDRWIKKLQQLRDQGLFRAIGLSLNRWEPWNGLRAVRSGLIDAVQVIYNIFDQSPEDELFPACQEMDVAVIARVPFDEGSLTGTLTRDSKWPAGDVRNRYFAPGNLVPTLERVEALRPLLAEGMTMPGLALRFILSHPAVATTIPGMRRPNHVEDNVAASDAGPLPPGLREQLRHHRWDR